MKILVPTDFSDLARLAVDYAAAFASYSSNPMVLMNNLSVDSLPRAGVLINIEEKAELNTREDLNDLATKTVRGLNPVPDVFCELTKMNSDAKAIIDKANEINAGVIVMGTNGSSGLTGALLGSVSNSVIRESIIPVIIVPHQAKFSTEGKIIFAIDLKTIPSNETLKHFHSICSVFNKKPEYLFTSTSENEPEMETFKKKINSLFPAVTCEYHTHPGKEPITAIDEFVNDNKSMLLALAPGTHSIFDRILGKSITTKLISHSQIPVLTLP